MEMNIFWDLPAYLFVILVAFTLIILVDKVRRARKTTPFKSSSIVLFAKDLFWVVLVVFVLRAFVIEPFRIPSGSMLPNLLVGDFVLVNKSSYGINLPLFNYPIIKFKEVKRGDVVVFRYPIDPDIPFIKRVIGVPGDLIVYEDKTIYINGQRITDEIQSEYDVENDLYQESLNEFPVPILKKKGNETPFNPNQAELESGVIVPEGYYFVMGDNRDNSNDSRFWGYVPEYHVLGKAILVWANIKTDGELLTLDFEKFTQFFTTFSISFDSVGRIQTGRID